MATVTVMDMGSMRIDRIVHRDCFSKLIIFSVAHILFFSISSSALAKNIQVTPTLSVQEVYSDNINLSSTKSETGNSQPKNNPIKGAFVTSVSPGIQIYGNTAKHSLNLNYQMQNIYNAGGNGGVNIFNQLQMYSHSTLLRNKLFADARGNIGQQNINNTRIVQDNFTGNSNRTNVYTFGVSPYWTPVFGNYASGLLRVNFDVFKTDQNQNNQTNLNSISDSLNVSEILQLNSGTAFRRFNWSLGFNNNENYRSGGNDVKFQNLNAIVRTHINTHFSLFASTGYSDNSVGSSGINGSNNGFFYTFGARWMPSQHYSIEAGLGNNSYVKLFISPIQRFSWTTILQDNSIGLNSGKTWQTFLNYTTRNSMWSVSRMNTTSTVQQLLYEQQNAAQQTPTNQQNTQGPLNPLLNNNLLDSVLVLTTWNLTASYTTGKSRLSASFFDQDRDYQNIYNNTPILNNISHENVKGISGVWSWQFSPKTTSYVTPMWQKINSTGTSTGAEKNNTDRFSVTIGINRQITSFINSSFQFSHITQTSNLDSNTYDENRASANLFMRF